MPVTNVNDGETVDGIVLNDGDTQYVAGTANNTIVNSGAFQSALHGTTNHTTVHAGGSLSASDGTVNDTIINVNGFLSLYDGSTSTGAILNGGIETLNASTSLDKGTFINNGGFQEVFAGKADGTLIADGGVQRLATLPSITDQIVAANTTVAAGGTQQIDLTYGTNVSITGTTLLAGGHIDVNGFGQDDHTIVTFNQATNVLTLQDGAQTFNMQLAGNYSGVTFDVTAYAGSTTVSLCFCRGTCIRTPAGDVPVELLRVGDEVVALGGKVRPVRWIGSTAAIVTNGNRPVIVRAGALPDGSPYRDLRVTHLHSFLFGDVLIPIGELVNGDSIAWDMAARTVEVFHLALDVHDVVLAEGAPAETYRDDGNRIGFVVANGEQGAARSMPTYAPVVRRGPIVERTRGRLAATGWSAAQSPTVRGSELVRSAIS